MKAFSIVFAVCLLVFAPSYIGAQKTNILYSNATSTGAALLAASAGGGASAPPKGGIWALAVAMPEPRQEEIGRAHV